MGSERLAVLSTVVVSGLFVATALHKSALVARGEAAWHPMVVHLRFVSVRLVAISAFADIAAAGAFILWPRPAAAIAACLVVAYSVAALRVPRQVLATAGCGCGFPGLDAHSRFGLATRNAVLMVPLVYLAVASPSVR